MLVVSGEDDLEKRSHWGFLTHPASFVFGGAFPVSGWVCTGFGASGRSGAGGLELRCGLWPG
jgi:hypothetical protein